MAWQISASVLDGALWSDQHAAPSKVILPSQSFEINLRIQCVSAGGYLPEANRVDPKEPILRYATPNDEEYFSQDLVCYSMQIRDNHIDAPLDLDFIVCLDTILNLSSVCSALPEII